MNKLFLIVGTFVSISILILTLYSSYLAFFPIKPFTINQQPFKVVNNVLHPGDPITFESDACRDGKYEVTVYPTLKGDYVLNLTPFHFVSSPGCSKILNNSLYVPQWTKPGKYYLELNNQIKITSNRMLTLTTTTEEFWVVKIEE